MNRRSFFSVLLAPLLAKLPIRLRTVLSWQFDWRTKSWHSSNGGVVAHEMLPWTPDTIIDIQHGANYIIRKHQSGGFSLSLTPETPLPDTSLPTEAA